MFSASVATGAPSAPVELVGTFAITGGSCAGTVQGSYFRMMTSGGASYLRNGDSTCSDTTYSPLLPGSDGGLVTGAYQPAPSPRYDDGGNGTGSRITRPTPFFGVAFATSTESVDAQTGTAVAPPSITADDGGNLTGTVAAFGAAWNREDFNQGSPKPDGSHPGSTSGPSGAYDASTGAFTLEWTSLIVGGPFNSFTGVWHLEGTFTPRDGAAAGAPADAPASGVPASSQGETSQGAAPAAAESEPSPGATADAATPAPTDLPAVGAATTTTGVAVSADAASGELLSSEGWRPATWLVVLTATLGVSAVVSLLLLSRPNRQAAALVVVAALVALAAMAIIAGRSDRATEAAARAPRTESRAPLITQPVADIVRAPPATRPPHASAPLVVAPAPPPAPPAPVDAPPPPAAEPAPAPEPAPPRECALGLPPPDPGGGVASLTPLVPFFGPFSAEAFAMMPAFEPAFPLFAPLLAAGAPLFEEADPALSTGAPLAQELEQSGFDLLEPLYTPYRQSLLDGEAATATALAPLVESTAAAPGTECIIALEGMLTALADSGSAGG